MVQVGRVYLVGAGPGDPKLLTVKGQELLQQAEVVIYDHLVSPRILRACSPTAKRVYVGKEAEKPSATQDKINALLVREAKAGKLVVRLKGGDPLLFGRGGEEALALHKAGVHFEIVAGVSSVFAVPAYAGIPITHRALSSSVSIITGHEDPAKKGSAIPWDELATSSETLVCLMSVRTLPAIVAQLLKRDRRPSAPCAIIEWGTTPRQRTIIATLATILARAKAAKIQPPAILVVGDVVTLRKHLNWFETKSLFGRRILVTRASDKAASLTDKLESLGADVEELPAIELAPVKRGELFREAVQEIPNTDWVFFTSPEGLKWFTRMLKRNRRDLRCLLGCHIGAIGTTTAASIEEAGLHVDFIPQRFSQEGILEGMPRRILSGKRGLIFCAQESRDVLVKGLRAHGMTVKKIPIYRTVMPRTLANGVGALFQRSFDAVTVTSVSCVEHLFRALRAAGKERSFSRLRFASIGPVTSRAVREYGGCVMVEATHSTIEGLVEALVRVKRW